MTKLKDTSLSMKIDKWESYVNPNLKENILNNIFEWHLLWELVSTKNERELFLDKIINKYSKGDRNYKDKTIFNFDVIDNKIYFSIGSIAPLAWEGQTIIYKIKNWKIVKDEIYSTWMN